MPIRVVCECGRRLDFKDEYAGREVRCPDCGKTNTVGAAGDAAPAGTAGGARVSGAATEEAGDPAFDRDKFLLKQKALKISETYDVADDAGNTILVIQRPAYLLKNLLALGAGLATWFVVGILIGYGLALLSGGSEVLSPGLELANLVLQFVAILAGLAVATMVAPKRHVDFYRDPSMKSKVLQVQQDKKWQPITATYTVKDERGRTLALFRKNYFFNLFRKKWVATTPGGAILVVAREDSVILSLLRRILGPLLGLLRAHFVFYRGDSDVVVGEFNRQLTLFDRYVLDLSRDPRRQIDRRIALALGVMLDTGERR